MERLVIHIRPDQRAVIRQLAKDHGDSSEAAALRSMIDQWTAMTARARAKAASAEPRREPREDGQVTEYIEDLGWVTH